MSDISSWYTHAAIRLLLPRRGTWHRKWTGGSLHAGSIWLGITDQFMDVTLSTSLCTVLSGVSESACSGRASFRAHQTQISTGWVLDQAFSIPVQLWHAAFHSALFCPFLVHCILLEQNLPTDMYRYSVLLIKDISALPVFTKESNHALTSLHVCSDLHYFAQALAKVPCSEQW